MSNFCPGPSATGSFWVPSGQDGAELLAACRRLASLYAQLAAQPLAAQTPPACGAGGFVAGGGGPLEAAELGAAPARQRAERRMERVMRRFCEEEGWHQVLEEAGGERRMLCGKWVVLSCLQDEGLRTVRVSEPLPKFWGPPKSGDRFNGNYQAMDQRLIWLEIQGPVPFWVFLL